MTELQSGLERILDDEQIRTAFEKAIQSVLSNIADPETYWKKPRAVTIKVTIKPDDQRQIAEIGSEVSVKLAPRIQEIL